MNILKRIKFAIKYDIDVFFIVISIPEQMAFQFIKYEDAKKFSESQIGYRPNIMVVVNKKEV